MDAEHWDAEKSIQQWETSWMKNIKFIASEALRENWYIIDTWHIAGS